MRFLLVNLGLVGDEFKAVRQHLTKRLTGSRSRVALDRPAAPAGGSDGGGQEVAA